MWAAIPIKPIGQAKSRLSQHLKGATRGRLFIAMLKDMLSALSQSPEIERLLLLSSTARAGALALEFGAELLEDDGSGGLNGACNEASRYVAANGGKQLLILHGDLPLVRPLDIKTLAAIHADDQPALTLIPNRTDTGTNGMLVTPPELIRFQFGADSLQRHIKAAKTAGVKADLARLEHLALDVDVPEDLRLLQMHRCVDCHTIRLLNELNWPVPEK